MSTETAAAEGGESFGGDLVGDLRDALLRGIGHSLSNRAAALGGVAGLVDPGEVFSERLSAALHGEVSQLEEIVRLMRLLPRDRRLEPEPLEIQALIPDIVALHAFHPDLRDIECTLGHDRDAMPAHANRSRFVHALLVVIDAAKRHARAFGGRVTVEYSSDPERITIVAESRSDGSTEGDGNGVAPAGSTEQAVARIGGGMEAAVVDRGVRGMRAELKVPTLLEGRRRERLSGATRSPSDA